ncbi:hypothetical protein A9G24_02925 [Gilliamella sp. App6-5]|nr:hypothetical protein A9G24_02925 [Gilliamella apicola]
MVKIVKPLTDTQIKNAKPKEKDYTLSDGDGLYLFIKKTGSKIWGIYIEHTKTKAYSPQTNGICERFHKTMKTECYDIMFRRKIYTELKKIQQDIELWLEFYNRERAHSGKYCYGKTPWQTWVEAKQLENLFYSSDSYCVRTNADE